MSLTRHRRLFWGLAGFAALGAVWLGPLAATGLGPFTRHMVMHMAVVAVAAPLLALAVAGSRLDPVTRAPEKCSAIVASVVEMVAVWSWHAPALHHAARHTTAALLLEQGMFLLSGLFLWLAALGGVRAARRRRVLSGVAGLWLTSMHMTLLGALIALSPRLLYGAHGAASPGALTDQHVGGLVMIFAGGAIYLFGGVGLARDALSSRKEPACGG
jgi:putative membrane protein